MEARTLNGRLGLRAAFAAPFIFILTLTTLAASVPVVAGRLNYASESGISEQFGLGAKRRSVLETVGLPDVRVGSDLWIYDHSRISLENSQAKHCDTLIIVFKEDRVVAMKLTDGNTLRDLLAKENLKTSGPSYAALLR